MTKSKKMGRPKLPAADKRSIMLSTRVNQDENSAVENAAKKAGKEKTVWLRESILNAAK